MTLVADALGLTREAVYRAMAMLQRQGRIRREPNAVYLAFPPVATARRTAGEGR